MKLCTGPKSPNVNIALRRILQNHGNIATEESPKKGHTLLVF